MAVFIRFSGTFELKMTTYEFSSSHFNSWKPLLKNIATCILRILINIIWLNRHLHSHTYIHNTQIVALIIEISFAWGLGKFTLICRSPNSIASNKMPRVNMVFDYQTTRNTEKCDTNFQQI